MDRYYATIDSNVPFQLEIQRPNPQTSTALIDHMLLHQHLERLHLFFLKRVLPEEDHVDPIRYSDWVGHAAKEHVSCHQQTRLNGLGARVLFRLYLKLCGNQLKVGFLICFCHLP